MPAVYLRVWFSDAEGPWLTHIRVYGGQLISQVGSRSMEAHAQ
jgi:hypothetical protein